MPQVISNPWELSGVLSEGASGQREVVYTDGASVVYPGHVEAYCSVTGKRLERKIITLGSEVYSVFDLPGPALDGDSSVYEKICVIAHDEAPVDEFDVTYVSSDSEGLEESFDSILNSAYFMCRQVFKSDKAMPPTVCWSEIHREFFTHKDNDPAQQAAIVDLAHELPLHLDKVTAQPRRALRRIRDQERIQRVREIDMACIRDLARRPGLAIAEKAGPRQRILAVKREETSNTLENRVVRHCCHLIRRAAERYVSAHEAKKIDRGHSVRLESVCAFERKAIKWNQSEGLAGVAMLASPCKSPNYVLLQNPSYLRIWQAYAVLVKNEELRANVWRWPLQLWRGVATVTFTELFFKWIEQMELPVKENVAEKRMASAPRNFAQGRFLNHDSLPGPYILGRSVKAAGTLHLVDHEGLSRLYPKDPVSLMNADYYLVWILESQRKIIPVYCRSIGSTSSDCVNDGRAALSKLKRVDQDLAGVILLSLGSNKNYTQVCRNGCDDTPAWLIKLSVTPTKRTTNKQAKGPSPIEWLIG